jgi:putative ABC transport system ATP-binding protein
MPDLEVRDLTVEFSTAGYPVRPLDKLSFDAEDGELAVVVGPSGCGKTTLLSCLAGLLTPHSGSIRFRGEEVTHLAGPDLARYRMTQVGVVFQAFNLIPSLTARANVMAPLRLAGVHRRAAHTRADDLLAKVGLLDRAGFRPRQMSGGQQQRVAIARALVHNPPLVLADEPTAHLDYVQVEGVLRLLRELASPGRIALIVTHDDRITHIADRVIELVPRSTTADGEPEEVLLEPGDLIFQQGDRGVLVYVVEEGAVELFRSLVGGEDEIVGQVAAGDYFGEIGPLLNLPRSASARALTKTRLTGYPVRAFRRRFPASRIVAHIRG